MDFMDLCKNSKPVKNDQDIIDSKDAIFSSIINAVF